VKPINFEALARLPEVQYYETAFRTATGVPLRVVAPDGTARAGSPCHENPFCALAARSPGGCAACAETESRALASVSSPSLRDEGVGRGQGRGVPISSAFNDRMFSLAPRQLYCYAGLTVVTVPVVTGGRHIATLLSGQVFRREPTARDFLMVSRMLGGAGNGDWLKRARRAYFDTPVVTSERFQAVLQLLSVYARFLSDFADRRLTVSMPDEPAAVANAKQFVQSHVEEPIDLTQVVEHVHVSRFYFCKLFKKATGMTLTEYVARVRTEKAKSLLGDSSMRISEVVFAAGFGSVPRFNSVFRRLVGMAPTQYRESLRGGGRET